MANVVLYSKDYCPHCVRAKMLLKRKKQSFEEIDITKDSALQQSMIQKSGGRRTVPQIFIDDVSIGGADELYKLDKEGKLDSLLGIG